MSGPAAVDRPPFGSQLSAFARIVAPRAGSFACVSPAVRGHVARSAPPHLRGVAEGFVPEDVALPVGRPAAWRATGHVHALANGGKVT